MIVPFVWTILFFVSNNIAKADEDFWTGKVYPTENFKGNSVQLKPFNNLDFNWGKGSPAKGIPTDHFSTIFQRKINLDEGGYNLQVWVNDGVQVYVDGKLKINQWQNVSTGHFAKPIYLKAGTHTIKIKQKEISGISSLKFMLDDLMRDNRWYGMAFPKENLTGTPVLLGYKPQIQDLNFNWGRESPAKGIPADHFSTIFQRKFNLDEGAYNLQVWANDGVQVYVDGELKIDQWKNVSTGHFAKPIYLKAGTHTVKIKQKEISGISNLKFMLDDLMRDNRWYGMAFPKENLTGTPVLLGYKPQIPDLNFNWGRESPAKGIPADHFSTIFQRKFNLDEGAYNLQVWANDGVQVYVDGELKIDQWKNVSTGHFAKPIYLKAGTHTIKIKQKEISGISNLKFMLDDLLRDNRWYGMVFPKDNLTGSPVLLGYKPQIPYLDFNWGYGSPAGGIPSNHFSAVFQRKINIEKNGSYVLNAKANDGVRVYVDGKRMIDSWIPSNNRLRTRTINLSKGTHVVRVEYKEITEAAALKFDIKKPGPNYIYRYTNYDLTVDQMINKQMELKNPGPQTDVRFNAYVSSDAIDSNGRVNGDWNVRSGPGTNYDKVDLLHNGETVSVVSGENDWYEIRYLLGGWENATYNETSYYINPNNFSVKSDAYFQFLKLSESAQLNADEVNQKILGDKGILKGRAHAFIQAGEEFHVNEIYLISHALLETGNGESALANGVYSHGKKVYNMYGIGARDSCPIDCGAEYAYEHGWFSPDSAIIGGAEFIAESYISKGQDTLYKMRWNPANPAAHQYATDIGWAVKQTSKIDKLYNLLESYTLVFDVPRYKVFGLKME
ncbi:beta-N-acetylglucosaminidase [Scopulibacillus darangshiensis]|uniref:Beta-N-acetylglucosaminidase n=1 Tax=Scopulibacillus darangshiensis TaxID=442528 RepID=A0A4R2N9M3_9BACL|nr:PA14 domain-containing protein [Scopulibacillus darangshiensis]TCP17658.1 beta-N-acetylglucosaminidase [Scopulibacillus darangshiensis]